MRAGDIMIIDIKKIQITVKMISDILLTTNKYSISNFSININRILQELWQ